MGYYPLPPRTVPGHGIMDVNCIVCGCLMRRSPSKVNGRNVCGSKCRAKLIRKEIDEDPALPQITCKVCGRVFRTRALEYARCPDCLTGVRL
jgi:hypothetical protein